MGKWAVTPSNTVTASEALIVVQQSDGPTAQRVIVQNTGAATLYLNWDAAATANHMPLLTGESVEFYCTEAQTLYGFCATSTTVVVTTDRV